VKNYLYIFYLIAGNKSSILLIYTIKLHFFEKYVFGGSGLKKHVLHKKSYIGIMVFIFLLVPLQG